MNDQIEYEVTFLLDGLAKFGFELWLRVLGKQATNLTLHSFFGFPLFYKIFSQGGKSFNRVKRLQGLMNKMTAPGLERGPGGPWPPLEF